MLEHAGLVENSRVGRESLFCFRPAALGQARSYLDEVSCRWDEALGRLRAFVDG